MYKTKQTAKRTFPPLKPPNFKAPIQRESSYSDSYSHDSCPTSSCDSCFGYIYDNGYDSNTEEWDEEDDEDDDDDDEAQSSACQSQVTDPFSMSSMSSLFGPPSFSSQQSHGFALSAPPLPLPSTSRAKERAQQPRCSCQKPSKGYCNVTAGPPSGVKGQNQNPNTTETQLSIFSSNGQTGIGSDKQTQSTDSQALGHLLGDSRSTADVKGKNGNGNGNGMIKNLNVYNPNITIQVTPENFNRFSKFFPQKSGNASNGK